MIYKFNTPEEYENFLLKHTSGSFSSMDMEVLIEEVKKLKPGGTYVEIGVDGGMSLGTATLAAEKGVKIVGIDIADTEDRRRLFEVNNGRGEKLSELVVFIQGLSANVNKIWNYDIDVLFIDGNHFYEFVCQDIDLWVPFVKPGGVVLFHDYDETSPGVLKAVNEKFKNIPIERFGPKTSMARIRL